MFPKCFTKILLGVLIGIFIGCDNANQLKEAGRDFNASKDLQFADFIDAADSMAFFNCESNKPLFASRLKKDFDELVEALSFDEKKECRGICFDKQWPSYYLELYRNGEPIDSTFIFAAHKIKGYTKIQRLGKKRYSYYIADSLKLRGFFESRHITKLPFDCKADKRWPRGDCGLLCRPVEASDIQITDSNGVSVSDSSVLALVNEIKRAAHFKYARYSADSNKHFDLESLVEMRIVKDFIVDFSFTSNPKIEFIDFFMKDRFEFGGCFGCSDGTKLVKVKLSFKDKSPKGEIIKKKSLAYDIARADSMAVISCFPEDPVPLFPQKKDYRQDSVSKNPVPLRDKKLEKRKMGIPKLTTFTVFASSNKKDLEELSEALSIGSNEACDGYCFDKQWSSYYVELFKAGTFISGTSLYTGPAKGYNKDFFNFYFENVEKVHGYFRTRNVYPMPWGCFASRAWRKD